MTSPKPTPPSFRTAASTFTLYFPGGGLSQCVDLGLGLASSSLLFSVWRSSRLEASLQKVALPRPGR
ncbi:unnamed protein product [Linum trigynum]|uniref:Uncharacterized protein n=1 Tax=Linum trigynum TaxID=586398 RepID=A0AAV2GPS0_9ROSI